MTTFPIHYRLTAQNHGDRMELKSLHGRFGTNEVLLSDSKSHNTRRLIQVLMGAFSTDKAFLNHVIKEHSVAHPS
jgi:hypothetical protein